MLKTLLTLHAATLGLAGLPPALAASLATETANSAERTEMSTNDAFVLDHEADRITGETEVLSEVYQGKVILIVNVASRCGFTRQYTGLQKLYEDHKDDGLVILGFPANDFGGQEPGSNEEILEFCRSSYDVTFPMFAKIAVTGDDAHPLYDDLRNQPEPIGGEPQWNFTKFLVDRSGEVVSRFGSRVDPTGDELVEAVEALLAEE